MKKFALTAIVALVALFAASSAQAQQQGGVAITVSQGQTIGGYTITNFGSGLYLFKHPKSFLMIPDEDFLLALKVFLGTQYELKSFAPTSSGTGSYYVAVREQK